MHKGKSETEIPNGQKLWVELSERIYSIYSDYSLSVLVNFYEWPGCHSLKFMFDVFFLLNLIIAWILCDVY